MLFTTHATVGAAVGTALGNPYLGTLAGILSHHILDALPHFDQGSFKVLTSGPPYLGKKPERQNNENFTSRDWIILFADWLVSGIIFAFIFLGSSQNWSALFAGTIGGLLPDIIDSSPLWSDKLQAKSALIKKYHSYHEYFHWTAARSEIALGILTQIILISASLIYLMI